MINPTFQTACGLVGFSTQPTRCVIFYAFHYICRACSLDMSTFVHPTIFHAIFHATIRPSERSMFQTALVLTPQVLQQSFKLLRSLLCFLPVNLFVDPIHQNQHRHAQKCGKHKKAGVADFIDNRAGIAAQGFGQQRHQRAENCILHGGEADAGERR